MDSHIDIIFFALLAVIFFVRLWSVLGRRDDSGEDLPPLQNPFAPKEPETKGDDVLVIPGKARDVSQPPVVTENGFAIASLAGSLDRLKAVDPSFDEKQFLEGAKIAFRMIVDAFAKGDLSQVERLLSPSVAASFKDAVSAEASSAGPRVQAISDAALTNIEILGDETRLTVDFTSLQTPASLQGQTVEIHDRWIFGRSISANNPNWILVATSA